MAAVSHVGRWAALLAVGGAVSWPAAAAANPIWPPVHVPQRDPGCAPEPENRGHWGGCRYCPLGAEDPYGLRNLDPPADNDPDDEYECGRLDHIGFRERCMRERAVIRRRVLTDPPATSQDDAWHYDTEDQLVAVENEAGELYRFTLDARGLVHEETGFDDFTRRYTRDRAGRVTRVDKPSGRVDELAYDAAGRITDVRHSDGTFERYRYRADGALIEASNDTAEVHFERDEMGRIVRERTRLADGSEHWVRSGYGPDGHRVRVESSDGHMHHIERNVAGDVIRVELEGQRWWVDFERDPLGLELSRTFPSGVTSRWDRDQVGRPMKRTVTFRGEKTLDEKRYVWEGDDQIRAILDPQHGDAHYKHDARGRLVWAKLPWGEEQHRAMDAVGNIYRSPRLDDRRYGKGGRIEEADGTKYRHDEDGNLIEKTDVLGDMTRYRWNGAGMLEAVELPDGREVSFEYDVLARRLGRRAGSSTRGECPAADVVRWTWDLNNPLVEVSSRDQRRIWLFAPESFEPVASLAGQAAYGALTDHVGAPTHLVNAGGGVDADSSVDAFGHRHSLSRGSDIPLRYPGQYDGGADELVYNRFRYLDSGLGAYLSADPIGLMGGLNLRGYVANPLWEIDPLGLSPYVFPTNPTHFGEMVGSAGVTSATPDGTPRVRWQLSETLRVRYESHPGGLTPSHPNWAPRHHGPHYHVEIRIDPARGWNAPGNVMKVEPPGYAPGHGTGFLPGEELPGDTGGCTR